MQKVTNEKSNKSYNPTTEYIAEVILVCRTDENYQSPESVDDIWYN